MRWYRDPLVLAGIVVGMIANGFAFFSVEYLPLIDWGNHIGLISILAHGDETGASAYFVRSLQPTPYLLFYGFTALVGQLVSVTAAGKCSLMLTTGLLTAGAAMLAESCGRNPRLALIAPLALFGMALGWGFGSFVFSMPFMLFGMATAERVVAAPKDRKRFAALAVAVTLAYMAHGMMFVITGLAIGVRGFFTRDRRVIVTLAASAVPTILLILPVFVPLWLQPFSEAGTEAGTALEPVYWTPLSQHLRAMQWHLIDRGHPDNVLTMKFAGALLLAFLAFSLWRPMPKGNWGLEIYALVIMCVFLFGPMGINWPIGTWKFHERFGTMAFLLVFLVQRPNLSGRIGGALASLALPLVLHNAWITRANYRSINEYARLYEGVRERIPAGSRVLSLTVVPRNDMANRHPLLRAMHFYLLVDGAALTNGLFNVPVFPVHWRSDIDFPRAPFWRTPHAFDPKTHGVDHDYLVLRGPGLIERAKGAGLHDVVADVHGWVIFKTKSPTPKLLP